MGLAILHHLQSMLDGAEEDIGFVQLRGDLRFEHARRRQGAQGLARIARPQRGIAPAMDKLMHLREEFDLPYAAARSEEHTSELQSLMRISYAVFCLKKKSRVTTTHPRPCKRLYRPKTHRSSN